MKETRAKSFTGLRVLVALSLIGIWSLSFIVLADENGPNLPMAKEDEDTSTSAETETTCKPEKGGVQERFGAYVDSASATSGSPQACVREQRTPDDLPALYKKLAYQPDSNSYAYVLMAICILESNQEKAFDAVVKHLHRPVNWYANCVYAMAFYDSQERCSAVDALGYLSSRQSSDYLISLLDWDTSWKIVVDSAGPESDWVAGSVTEDERNKLESLGMTEKHYWVVRSTRALQRGAVFGLMVRQDDALFQHVEDVYGQTLEQIQRKPNILLETWANLLQDRIGLYRFYKDKGWEEGHRILGSVDWEIQAFVYRDYYPDPEDYK